MRGFGVALGALALASCAATGGTPPATVAVAPQEAAKLRQVGAAVLFWSQEERFRNFPAMEKLFPGTVARAGRKVRALPQGAPLPIAEAEVAAFMAAQNVTGLLVLQDGKVRMERYARGYGPEGRWTSFSVAKSVTSTLVGAAIKDGYIKSIDDPVTRYIPDLAGAGYDGVSIRQLLTMTSGVKWNEDYTDPNSDVARMFAEAVPAGMDPTVFYMRKLPRESEPGAKFVYKTGETNLIGVLVRRATGKSLSAYLEEKIWKPFGMERDAFWMTDQTGAEVSGCCLSVSLRDYGRIGQMALEGGKGIVPAGWFADATKAQVTYPGGGYGYQWWVLPGGTYAAQGIFGQVILVDPSSKLVMVTSAAWPRASDRDLAQARLAFAMKVQAAARQ
ncbi:CubicO group peptidase (beta-lactamase class C family) [Sphingomonas sp. BE123]|jgi:CubicO group peptidase (beta-lactamase class C family)|uniref:serine hydrolase domain-containing protein n=1 Tax=Sphingomonas sp. BE123 TaxID=2817842 RepID=UPI0028604575|nr:serine hydrolase domain-containing protein [Sphingomonas sp. BE123]MDR6851172.1 CubicO group peptidase (beta-lactamase class C family) [Sphingomonas sp. BE123]